MRDTQTQLPSLRRIVQEKLERRILSGKIKPGYRLAQQSLARELGVGQGTVRESLLELQWLGLVESVDGLGVFTKSLDTSQLCEAYEVRELLEGHAARRACANASNSDVALLRGLADQVWALSIENNEDAMGAADRMFHLQIIRLSHNSMLSRLAETYRVLGMAVRTSREPGLVREEHFGIVDAIARNMPNEAERLARQHVERARKVIEQQSEDEDFALEWAVNFDGIENRS
jgi:DNA-binding GntR family transcriptional regulator